MTDPIPTHALLFKDRLSIRTRLFVVGLAVVMTMGIAGWIGYEAQRRTAERGFYFYDTVFQSVSYARAAQTDWSRLHSLVHLREATGDDAELDAFAQAAYGQSADDALAYFLGEARANLEVAGASDLAPRLLPRYRALIEGMESITPKIMSGDAKGDGARLAELVAQLDSLSALLELFVQDLAAEGFRIRQDMAEVAGWSAGVTIASIGLAVLVVALLSVYFGARIVSRLRTASEFSSRVATGDLDGEVMIQGRTELTMLMDALVRMRTAIRNQINQIDHLRLEADSLLDTILPPAIAARLRHGEERIADACAEATIVFVDLVGFTDLTRRFGAAHVIETLDEIFRALDEAVERNGIEKIKTIGDGYMAAAGITQATETDDAARCARFALEAKRIVEERAASLGYPLDIRIGIHNGPVIAGILGKSRLVFDVWGAAVNLASRLEASAENGEIRISEAAYWRLHNDFDMDPLGEVTLKGIGDTPVYVLRADRQAA